MSLNREGAAVRGVTEAGWAVLRSVDPVLSTADPASIPDVLTPHVERAYELAEDPSDPALKPGDVTVLSPVTRPCQIVAQGAHHHSHASDNGGTYAPVFIMLFRKSSAPTSGSIDDEVLRVFTGTGLGKAVRAVSIPGLGMRLVNRLGSVLLELPRDSEGGNDALPEADKFTQPKLDAVLRDDLTRPRPSMRSACSTPARAFTPPLRPRSWGCPMCCALSSRRTSVSPCSAQDWCSPTCDQPGADRRRWVTTPSYCCRSPGRSWSAACPPPSSRRPR